MKTEMNENDLMPVNGGAVRIKETGKAPAKEVKLDWHWGDDWGEDTYWH